MSLPPVPENLENIVRVREYLVTLRNGIDLEAESLDKFAADRIVSLDPSQGTDTTIQSAINNLPVGGGTIYIKSGTYTISSPISFGDKNYYINFSPGAILQPQGNIEIFQFLNGQTARHTIRLDNLSVVGDQTKTQTLIALKDTGSLAHPILYNPFIKNVRTICDIQAGDLSYSTPVEVDVWGGRILPIDNAGTSVLAKSPMGAAHYQFGMTIRLHNVTMADFTDLTKGFGGLDFDGEFLMESGILVINGLNKLTGMDASAGANIYGGTGAVTDTLNPIGNNFFTSLRFSDITLQKVTLHLGPDGFFFKITDCIVYFGGRIVCESGNGELKGIETDEDFGVAESVEALVDILATGNNTLVSGRFTSLGASVAVIRTAGVGTRIIGCTFGAGGGGVNTIKEVGSADYSEITGCTGLATGNGLALLGAHTRINGSLDRNVMDFGADPTGVADSRLAFANALAAIPGGIKGIVRIPPGTYKLATTLSVGDIEPEFIFEEGALLTHAGLGANPAFKFLDGLTVKRFPIIDGIQTTGNNVSTDSLFELNDANSLCKLDVRNPKISGWRTVVDIKGRDLTYVEPAEVFFYGGNIFCPTAGSAFLKTVQAGLAFAAGTSIWFLGCNLLHVNDPGWTINFDGDLIIKGGPGLEIGASSTLSGLEMTGGACNLLISGTLESGGGNYWATGNVTAAIQGGTFKLSSGGTFLNFSVFTSAPALIINGPHNDITILYQVNATAPAISVDILAGADANIIRGTFKDSTTAVIRTAAQKTRIMNCDFVSTGVHNTVLETGAADLTLIDDCIGLASGAGVLLIGDNSTIVDEAVFEARVQRDSATQLSLQKYEGRKVSVAGELVGIPSAGLTLLSTAHTITGAGADSGVVPAVATLHYLYISNSNASFSPSGIRLSTTVPTLVRGVKYLGNSGNALNWRFVGWIYTIDDGGGNANFVDSASQRFVVNYYNRRPAPLAQQTPGYVDDNALTSFNELGATGTVWRSLNGGTGVKTEFISNGEDVAEVDWEFWAEVTAGTPDFAFSVADDGSLNPSFGAAGWGNITGVQHGQSIRRPVYAEGYHYLTYLFAMSDAAGTVKVYTDTHRFGGTTDVRLTKFNGKIMV